MFPLVRTYFKHILFYVLEFCGVIINLVGALFCYYPKLELGINFLILVEEQRYSKETEDQSERRKDLSNNAQQKFDEARNVP